MDWLRSSSAIVRPAFSPPGARRLARDPGLTVYTQDDPSFPETVPGRVDDTCARCVAPAQNRDRADPDQVRGGREVARAYGWDRGEWERLTGITGLGRDLPDARPGCGAKNVEPGVIERLKVRFNETGLKSRRIEIGADEDEQEAMFARGWSDGLPLVPPTEERVLRMLDGTARDPQEVLGLVPPALATATVEKIAINAVMAGCKPEYLPVVLAAVEAVLDESFAMHGVLATTMFVGPVVIVNGPIRRRIGMNAKGNALGQGNRANAAIGRALQLVIRNIGEGRPQEVDRATLGNPGKLSYCFAEDEEGSSWEPLSVERGLKPGQSAVTVFAGYGLQGVVDQKSRDPESLARSFAGSLQGAKQCQARARLRRAAGRLPGASSHLQECRLVEGAALRGALPAVRDPRRRPRRRRQGHRRRRARPRSPAKPSTNSGRAGS